MKYRTIVADPPWAVKTGPSWGANDKSDPLNARSHSLAYPTMSVEEIAAMPVRDMAEDDAHLYIWTVNRYVEDAYQVARAWGFKPSTLLTWCKEPKGIGLGGTFALSSEFVLFARRGTLVSAQRLDRNWWVWPRSVHSKKPEAFIDMVEQVSPPPYVELFARRHRLGWDVHGNESANTAQMEAIS